MDRVATPNSKRALVFLDTNVVLGYIRGDPSEAKLFAAGAADLIHLSVNPIVLQELLLADATELPAFEEIRGHLHVIPLDLEKIEEMMAGARSRRYHTAHANDMLILSSAEACNFLVTRDEFFRNVVIPESLEVMTPEELVSRLGV